MGDRDLKFKEIQYSTTMDTCAKDAAIKTGSGGALGGFFSLLFTKVRKWPVIFGAGVGLGLSLSACQTSLNNVSFTRNLTMEIAEPNVADEETVSAPTLELVEGTEFDFPTEEIVMQEVDPDSIVVHDAIDVSDPTVEFPED